jgi:glycosyltransferase involved in cell wall biosynthesis
MPNSSPDQLSTSDAITAPLDQNELTVSVVICAYTEDRWDDLARAVKSARNQTVPPHEVVVVVDHSRALLERAKLELVGVSVVPNTQRAGLAGARNSGVEATHGAVVAFLDDDATADPDWLAELRRGYLTQDVLGVGGRIDPQWQASRPAWFPDEFNWVVGCTYRGVPVLPSRVRNMIGANMSARRTVLDAVGGFRQQLGRLEETDFCIRGQELFPEGEWLYWPAAHVTHSVSPERSTWSYFRARCYNEGAAKAAMVMLTSRQAGLASERSYTLKVLPIGIVRELARIGRWDISGTARAAAIAVGLAYTTAGYARTWLTLRRRSAGTDVDIPRRGSTP